MELKQIRPRLSVKLQRLGRPRGRKHKYNPSSFAFFGFSGNRCNDLIEKKESVTIQLWFTYDGYEIYGIYGYLWISMGHDMLQGSTMVAMDERLDQMLAHLDGHQLSRILLGPEERPPGRRSVLLDIHGDSKYLNHFESHYILLNIHILGIKLY